MSDARTFVFRYEGNAMGEEEWTDFAGDLPIPQRHDVLYRRGRTWRVTRVIASRQRTVPVYQIFLSDDSCRGIRLVN
jgi:hypothetical protein